MFKFNFFKSKVLVNFKWYIKGYLGLTGAGKTLSLVQNEIIPALLVGRSVATNIWLNYKGSCYIPIFCKEDLHSIRNSLIAIDEVGDCYDPYDYLNYSKEDKEVFSYHRKRRNNIVFTAQDISQVAKALRTKIHTWVLCQSGSSFFVSWFYKFFLKTPVAVVRSMELRFADLKTLALGLGSFDLNSKIDKIDDVEQNDFSESFADDEKVSSKKDIVLPKISTKYYTNKHFFPKELESFRIYDYGVYCSECSDFLEYLEEKDISKIDITSYICPVHKLSENNLSIMPAPFYSTTEEIKNPNKDFIVKTLYKKTKTFYA